MTQWLLMGAFLAVVFVAVGVFVRSAIHRTLTGMVRRHPSARPLSAVRVGEFTKDGAGRCDARFYVAEGQDELPAHQECQYLTRNDRSLLLVQQHRDPRLVGAVLCDRHWREAVLDHATPGQDGVVARVIANTEHEAEEIHLAIQERARRLRSVPCS